MVLRWFRVDASVWIRPQDTNVDTEADMEQVAAAKTVSGESADVLYGDAQFSTKG
jgi:hypothetical protein